MKCTHSELVEAGAKWLLKTVKASVVIPELVSLSTTGEIPDVIGWKSGFSILLECKTSRADFFKDKKKVFRIYPDMGMGNLRLFLCPDNLIRPEELPENWGLLYYSSERKTLKRVVCWKGNIFQDTGNIKIQASNYQNESRLLVSYIRRNNL